MKFMYGKGKDMLKEKTKAPDFTLPDQNGDMHSLSDYKGKPTNKKSIVN